MDTGCAPDPPDDDAERAALVEARQRATRRFEALTRDFDAFVAGAELVNTDDEHDPEDPTIAFERAQVIALRDDAQRTIAALDHALVKLDDGTYGYCTVCGRPIGVERLSALPGVETCIECAASGRS